MCRVDVLGFVQQSVRGFDFTDAEREIVFVLIIGRGPVERDDGRTGLSQLGSAELDANAELIRDTGVEGGNCILPGKVSLLRLGREEIVVAAIEKTLRYITVDLQFVILTIRRERENKNTQRERKTDVFFNI